MVWVDRTVNRQNTPAAHIETIMNPPDLTKGKRIATEFRIWLRDHVKMILEMHSEENGLQGVNEQEPLRVVVCLYSGVMNFVVQE